MTQTARTRPARRGLDPIAWARRIRRATVVFAIAAFVAAFAIFGTRWVPPRMDTVPGIPGGSYCIVDKRQSAARVGRDVFVEAPGGDLVLSRVTARDDATITVVNPNAASSFPDSRVFGPLPLRALRGTVLCAFAPAGGSAGGR